MQALAQDSGFFGNNGHFFFQNTNISAQPRIKCLLYEPRRGPNDICGHERKSSANQGDSTRVFGHVYLLSIFGPSKDCWARVSEIVYQQRGNKTSHIWRLNLYAAQQVLRSRPLIWLVKKRKHYCARWGFAAWFLVIATKAEEPPTVRVHRV